MTEFNKDPENLDLAVLLDADGKSHPKNILPNGGEKG